MKNFTERNKRRCIFALVVCLLIISCSFAGVLIRILKPLNDEFPITGTQSFRYFTILSNMFINVCAILCIPYEIEGLLKNNYHLPRWIIDLMYVATTCTTITILVSLLVIAPNSGFKETFFTDTLVFLHLICPLLAVWLFAFINIDHRIPLNRVPIAVTPATIYMFIYGINVFMISEENGGWFDHYYIKQHLPFFLAFVLLLLLSYLVAFVLLYLHNKQHAKQKRTKENYYSMIYEDNNKDFVETVRALARENKKHYKEGDVIVPAHVIGFIQNKYKTEHTEEELYIEYIKEFMK